MSTNVETLHQEDTPALRALLTRDVPSNMYLLGLLAEFGIAPAAGRAPFAFYGNRHGQELSAAVFVGGSGGLVVPSASDEREIAPIAEHISKPVRLRAAQGEKQAVDTLVRYLCPERPRLSKLQRVFAVSADDLGPFTNPTLRLATEADLPQLVPMAAAEKRETVGHDPLAKEAEAFQAAVLQRVRSRRTYVLEENKRLIFKIEVGSRSPYGAELEGLYTLQEERRHGHATLSLGQISRHLLSSLPRLTIRVDEDNPSIAGVARKVGYVAGKLHRLVVAG